MGSNGFRGFGKAGEGESHADVCWLDDAIPLRAEFICTYEENTKLLAHGILKNCQDGISDCIVFQI
jgi:hypothetical protein